MRSGSCQCGNIQYEITGESLGLGVCYCTECQKLSTGFATYSMIINREDFHLTSGTLKQWERSSDSGARNIGHFCPECGNRIYHENPEVPEIIRLKAGTLNKANRLVPDVHVWLSSAPSWIVVPEGALCYNKQPPIDELLKALQRRKG